MLRALGKAIDRLCGIGTLRVMKFPGTLACYLCRPRAGALFVFMLALLLRTAGLSHDLDQGRIYHPDTSKQVRATERFLRGEYYTYIGSRDFEGYPYFNSHLAACIVRAYQAVRNGMRSHLGLPYVPAHISLTGLFWITRVMNAVLSSLAVVLVYWIGARFFTRGAGIIGSLLLAFSPTDITACRFAAGDTTAAFFALGCVYCALNIAGQARYRDYILAALLAAAAFSTKYHGAIALGAVGLAHLSFYRPIQRLFSPASIARGGVLIVAFILGVLVTSPALLVYPERAFKEIVAFLEYTASFGMTPEMLALSPVERFQMGMGLNMPVLLDILGPIVAGAAIVALIVYGNRWRTWIMAVVPLLYVLGALATKPLAHPVYHTMATPFIMLLAGTVLAALYHHTTLPRLGRTTALLLIAGAVTYLAVYARREIFFFRHNDSRLLSQSWAQDNIPPSFHVSAGAYTFVPEEWVQDPDQAVAHAFVFSDRYRVAPPRNTFLAHAIELESEKLTVFRNWNQYIYMPESEFLNSNYQRPGYQPFPSDTNDTILFAQAPWWVRNPKVQKVRHDSRLAGTLMSFDDLDHALWLVRTGPEPARLDVSIGGQRTRVRLGPQETRIIPVTPLRRTFITRNPHRFYSWRIRGRFGHALVHLATTPNEIAWTLFNAGAYEEAIAAFDAIPVKDRSIGDQLAYQISALIAGRPVAECASFDTFLAATDPLWELFGVSQQFIEYLPGKSFGRDILLPHPVAAPLDMEFALLLDHTEHTPLEWPPDITEQATFTYFAQTPLTGFEPGHYRVRLVTDGEPGPVRVEILDAFDRHVQTELVDLTHNGVTVPFIADDQRGWLRARIWGDRATLLTIRELNIIPDLTETMRSYAALARMLRRQDFEKAELNPLMYRPLVQWGLRHQSNQEWAIAYKAYTAAIQADPKRLQAYKQLAEMAPHVPLHAEDINRLLTPYRQTEPERTVHPADIRLRNGMTLTGYQISQRTVRPGETFGLNLFWSLPRLHARVPAYVAWVHAIHHEERAPAFYGDQPMITALRLSPKKDMLNPYFIRVRVPEDIRPGTYTLKTGLWIPAQRRNIRVAESSHPHDRRGAFITEIEIVE